MTGLTPYPTLRNAEVHRTLVAGGRIGKPEAMQKKVFDVLKPCFKKAPEARPTFSELSGEFAMFLREGAMESAVRDVGRTIKAASASSGQGGQGGQASESTAASSKGEKEETYYYSKGR